MNTTITLKMMMELIRGNKITVLLLFVFMSSCSVSENNRYGEWKVTGGTKEASKYSALSQIDTNNVTQLEVAWIYHSEGNDASRFGPMQCNPIIIDEVLYGVSPRLKLFAVKASTGNEIWEFDPADSVHNKRWWGRHNVNMNRGVAYWESGDDKRIIFTAGPIAYALNAITGELISSFGINGGIDLHKGLGRDESVMGVAPTSPVMVYKDLFFLSGLVSEATPGHIRAFDIRTGEQKWLFHTIPHPGEPGYETWEDTTAYLHMGSTNSWSGFSLDEERGILFAGTGNPTNDFYGGNRIGKGLYGNSVLALDAATGKLIWHYQTVRHDVWDMDISSAPVLFAMEKNGRKVDAVAQSTKTGFVFVFDRETGEPLFPIEERTVYTDTKIPGEALWPTQPYPVLPKPFVRQILTENDLNTLVSDSSYADIKQRFLSYRSDGMFSPPTKEGTIILPGYDGGGEWGGPSIDPETNILYVNANEMAWVLNIVENASTQEGKSLNNLEAGAIIYNKNCMSCHGPERSGSGNFPSIVGVKDKMSLLDFNKLLATGQRMMPAFNHLSKEEQFALATFVLEMEAEQKELYKGTLTGEISSKPNYGSTGYNKFLTKEGYPAISPPWGSLSAINMNTGEYVWKIPLGEYKELAEKGIPTTGRENYGGAVVTSGGILFIAATADGKFRAFNKRTGEQLWEYDLPAPGVATPATYDIEGKQFVVIACGGSKFGGKSSDAYVAFALPDILN